METVAQLLDQSQVLQSVAADLKRGTWTFATPAGLRVGAGEYVLVPLRDLRAAQAADAARVSAWLQGSDAPRTVEFSELGGGYRSYEVSTPDDGFRARMQAELRPDDGCRRGVWYGSMSLRDQLGRVWDHHLGYMLVDDFGDLVEVPE